MKGTSTCYSEVPQHKYPKKGNKQVVDTTLNHNYIIPLFKHNITRLDPYLRNAIKLPKNLESRRNPRNAPRTPRSNPPFPARSAATTRTTAFPRAPADRQNSRRSSRVKVGEEEGREQGSGDLRGNTHTI
ncbi:hypothetical protein Taro_049701 [Colocasia esculenta]|uniref:Uncharacterized protein n=1 Tax=Colocasia esculenta TaxID=4460 RepID=A0A843XBR3_COLES|nr:hypothetical protein [Colocasia esculenta]